MVRKVRNISWTEKKLCILEPIGRNTSKITLASEINGVNTASMKSIPINIMTSPIGLMERHKVRCNTIFPRAMKIKMLKPKTISRVDEVNIPLAKIVIQTIEKIKVRMAVFGSLACLSSSVNLYRQDRG